MAEKFYITTAIAYTSRKPHIGNTYEVVLTDAIARYKKQRGYDVYFLTGTDEHGIKIEEIAKENKISPKEYVDGVAKRVDTVVVSSQHSPEIDSQTIRKDIIENVILPVIPSKLMDGKLNAKLEGYGYGYAVVAHSRRVIYFDDVSKRPDAKDKSGLAVDGHGVMYGNTDDPNFSHYEAGSDAFVNLMFTFDGQNQ